MENIELLGKISEVFLNIAVTGKFFKYVVVDLLSNVMVDDIDDVVIVMGPTREEGYHRFHFQFGNVRQGSGLMPKIISTKVVHRSVHLKRKKGLFSA